MLGDYEKEAFDSGRGLKVRENTVASRLLELNSGDRQPHYAHTSGRSSHDARLPG